MASLSVRNLDDETYEKLRARAARDGISMEEEVRRILKRSVTAPDRLGDFFLSCFGPDNGIAREVPARGPHEPPDFTA